MSYHRLRQHVEQELTASRQAERRGEANVAFQHLERAHVLGQSSTALHARVHWLMLCWGLRHRRWREVVGQVPRLIGAATKTAIGWVPTGNTGGSNVSPFKPMPIAQDLQARIDDANAQ